MYNTDTKTRNEKRIEMFNTNVTNILGQVSGITNSVILKYPTTIVNSSVGDIMVSINMSSLDPEEFADVGIHNLSEFLSTFKLFGDDRVVTLSDKIISIREGLTSAEYISNNLTLLSEYNKSTSIIETSSKVPTVAEFILTAAEIKKIKSATGVFKDLEEVVVESKDGEVSIFLSASNKFNAKSNKFKLNIDAETTKEFAVKIPTENFNAIPVSDYGVFVKYNSTKDAYRILLKSTEVTDFKILMTVKK